VDLVVHRWDSKGRELTVGLYGMSELEVMVVVVELIAYRELVVPQAVEAGTDRKEEMHLLPILVAHHRPMDLEVMRMEPLTYPASFT